MTAPEVISALTTPFTDDGIDFDAFHANLQRLAPLVDGVFVAGTTGEFPALERSEHRDLLVAALETFGPDRTVAHVGAVSLHGAMRLAEAAAELGVRRFAAITPYYLPANAESCAAYFAGLRELLSGVELYAYLFPDVAGTDVLPADFEQLLDIGIDGVKLSGLASTRVADYLSVAPHGFRVWSGNDADLPAVLAAGGTGTVSGVSGACPQPWSDFARAYRVGDTNAVADAQRRIEILVPQLGPSIAYLRLALELQGIAAGSNRMSIAAPDAARVAAIEQTLFAAGLLPETASTV